MKLANHLSDNLDQWMTPNPKYDSRNPQSSIGFGLWFDFELEGNYFA